MSLLAEQLQTLRGEQRLQQIGPNLPQPSILFDPVTARSTSLDVIYTMAVLGYSKLLSCDPSLRRIGDLLFNDAHKHLNRNQLTR